MSGWDVPGQEHAVAVLQRAVERDEVAHAWAFIGPAGVGQEAAARWLAAGLNCGSFTPPCGACDICRRCLSGAYPALFEFAPVGAFHRVDDVREDWLRSASRSLGEGRCKVLRIIAADRMNEQAAMGSPESLARLATGAGLDDLRAHRAWPGLLREGGPGMALLARRAVDDEIKRTSAALKVRQQEQLDYLTELHGGELPAKLGKEMATRHSRELRDAGVRTVQAALDDLAGWLRDCVVVAQGGEPLIHLDAADSVGGDAAALGPTRLLQALDLVMDTREAMELNVQTGVTLEAMFLELSALSFS